MQEHISQVWPEPFAQPSYPFLVSNFNWFFSCKQVLAKSGRRAFVFPSIQFQSQSLALTIHMDQRKLLEGNYSLLCLPPEYLIFNPAGGYEYLTLSLPGTVMETFKVVLTFNPVDEILRCDHSTNESVSEIA